MLPNLVLWLLWRHLTWLLAHHLWLLRVGVLTMLLLLEALRGLLRALPTRAHWLGLSHLLLELLMALLLLERGLTHPLLLWLLLKRGVAHLLMTLVWRHLSLASLLKLRWPHLRLLLLGRLRRRSLLIHMRLGLLHCTPMRLVLAHWRCSLTRRHMLALLRLVGQVLMGLLHPWEMRWSLLLLLVPWLCIWGLGRMLGARTRCGLCWLRRGGGCHPGRSALMGLRGGSPTLTQCPLLLGH
mmetsp:Transcript_40587/g.53432  ORF Transcript_40587/g.53432 Transcript_40587/m.53432 type:complete len:240 (+) Transcript_40587:131-850(+)